MNAIPNILGFTRLGLAPVIFVLIVLDRMELAFWLFVFAGLTDILDGYTARLLGVDSDFGRFLDPFADKVLMNLTYIGLGVSGLLPVWLVALVFLRDFLLGVTASIGRARGQVAPMAPSILSKTNTGLQVLLASLVLADAAFIWQISDYLSPLALAVGATTVASGVLYLIDLAKGKAGA